MTSTLNFLDATMLATQTMVKHRVFAEVKRQNGGWRVVAGGTPSGDTPWVNLWRSLHNAIAHQGGDPKRVFWSELDRLIQAKDPSALAAEREILAADQQGSQVKDSFFHKAAVLEFKEYSKGVDDASIIGS